jgi:hypothetical protein
MSKERLQEIKENVSMITEDEYSAYHYPISLTIKKILESEGE